MTTFDAHLEECSILDLLNSPSVFAAHGLGVDDFTQPRNIAIVNAYQRLQEAGKRVTGTEIALEAQKAAGGHVDYESAITLLRAAPRNRMSDPEALKELRRLRALQAVVAKANQYVMAGDRVGALNALADAHQFGDVAGAELLNAAELADRVVGQLANSAEAEANSVCLAMPKLDRNVGRLSIGSLLVVAADTNVGKSGFALSMLVAMAQAGTTCGLISVEDSAETTGARLLGYFGPISSREIQTFHRQPDDGTREQFLAYTQKALRSLTDLGDRLLFEDCIGKNDLDVRASMSRMQSRGARLVVVDYIGEIASSSKQQDRRNEMRFIAKALKAHARRIGVALVLVSQIARPKGEDEFKCPSKHSLKESGDITNMAEFVIALWRGAASDHAPLSARIVKAKSGGNLREWTLTRDLLTGCLREG